MARYGSQHKTRSRARIVKAAAGLFRRQGYLGTGIDSVMAKAGLTAGAFYAHFGSKSELFAEALEAATEVSRAALTVGLEGLSPQERFAAVVKRYLSREHRDSKNESCVIPPLVSELSRADRKARRVLDRFLEAMIEKWEPHVPSRAQMSGDLAPGDRALATFCLMVGGIALARAVESEELSTRILKSCRALALGEKS